MCCGNQLWKVETENMKNKIKLQNLLKNPNRIHNLRNSP